MVTEFEAQLLSLTTEKQRLALLAKEATALLAEMTTPRDHKNEASQRANRVKMLETFCSNWGVTKLWANELIDRYEDQVELGYGHAMLTWLSETMSQGSGQTRDFPSPRVKSDIDPAFKLV